jgi:hypothetical protein
MREGVPVPARFRGFASGFRPGTLKEGDFVFWQRSGITNGKVFYGHRGS